jgi:hypothetical protein
VKKGATVKFAINFSLHPLEPSKMRGDTVNNPITRTISGTSTTFTFDRAGVFAYYCAFHGPADNGTNMAGAIWVSDSPSPDAGPPVDGGRSILGISPTAHDYGSAVSAGSSDTFTFTVWNTGNGPVGGFGLTIQGADFVAPAATNQCASMLALGPFNSCTVGVQFRPTSRGLKNGSLIASGGGETVTAVLTGRGQSLPQLAVSPMAQVFSGQVGIRGVPLVFTFANIGDASTGALTIALGGPAAGDFEIVSNGCLAPLGAGGSCQVSVAVNATTAGGKSATLTASSPTGAMATTTLTASVN